ncbi:MAG: MFS transporter, partial [Chloroflexia bacterium]
VLSVAFWMLPYFTRDIWTFGAAWAAVNGLSTGLFALSFTVLASSALRDVRGRVMTFAYLPVNLGYAVGPAIGSAVASVNIFLVFPVAAIITALSVAALTIASRTKVEGSPEEINRTERAARVA